MALPNWILRVGSHATAIGLRLFAGRFDGAFSIFMGRPSPGDYGTPETEFVTGDGRRIPVYKGYRYAVKAGWRSFAGLNLLAELDKRGRLNVEEAAYLTGAKGTRTIAVAPAAAIEMAHVAAERNAALFLPGSSGDGGLPELRPDERRLRETIAIFKRRHASMFQQLAAAGIFNIQPGAAVLEIGFTTGGHSIFAFEQMGFRAHGIDNYYGGLLGESTLHGYNRSVLGSKAEFVVGDITGTTSYQSESMDVVFSASVLEHIQDLEAAFVEMYRLVKPGGAIIHNYSPYFCHDGGHALGIGDSPWVHTRLNEKEYFRYLVELRPHEFEAARDWMANALHRNMPQWKVQRLVAAAGFRIGLWMAKPSARRWLRDLTPEIMRECMASTPDIGIEDLVSRSVSFVAIKA